MSGISVVFGGKKSTLPRSELPAAAALRCGAIISAPRRIFTAWTLIRTAKFTNATVLKYSSAIRGGLAHKLNEPATVRESLDPERRIVSDTTVFQKRANSIHLYPFVVVVEKNRADVPELVASTHGTEWLGGVRR